MMASKSVGSGILLRFPAIFVLSVRIVFKYCTPLIRLIAISCRLFNIYHLRSLG